MAVFPSGFVCRNRIVTACILYYNQPKSKNVCHIHAANYKAEGLILSQMKIKVLLADDNKDFCDIVVNYLQKQEDMQVVAVAMDGIDAYDQGDLQPALLCQTLQVVGFFKIGDVEEGTY